MKKFIKNNLKTILAVGATAIICISGTVFATGYLASQISYKDGKNVEEALNELYNKNLNISLYKSEVSSFVTNKGSASKVISNVEQGKYILVTYRTYASIVNNISQGHDGKEMTYTVTATNGNTQKIDNSIYLVEITSTSDITILTENNYVSTAAGGYIYAYLYKINN